MRGIRNTTTILGAATLLGAAVGFCSLTGCDNKEKVLDVETPRGEVEVERDRDTGETDVTVDDKE